MDAKDVCLAFQDFIENMRSNLEFRFNRRTWRFVRVPIKEDLAAIYGMHCLEDNTFEAKNLEFVAFTKGGCAFWYDPSFVFGFKFADNIGWLWHSGEFASALNSKAMELVRANGLDKDMAVPERIVNEDAKRIFLGEEALDREFPDFEQANVNAQISVLDKMPNLPAAAGVWLQQIIPGWNKQTVRDIIMKRLVEEERAKKVAQSWENDPGSDIFVLREILHSIPKDAKNVDIVYAGPNGLVTTKIPTHAFSAYVGNELKCQVNWNYVTPREECRRVERELRSPGNSMAADSISGVVKITYRGKTVYEK